MNEKFTGKMWDQVGQILENDPETQATVPKKDIIETADTAKLVDDLVKKNKLEPDEEARSLLIDIINGTKEKRSEPEFSINGLKYISALLDSLLPNFKIRALQIAIWTAFLSGAAYQQRNKNG